MTSFLSKEMSDRGVRDSVSDPPTGGSHHIPWSDEQRAQSHRDSTLDHSYLESPRIDVNVGFLIAGGECS
ncbi:hypothetical protein BANT918_02965 [Brevibacterium antiquum CNRZ 918]|uniref:Uncharacterized protein n=1 Tax=Brevibacterium antiquum CNRZ 918 TaxID=1255637 RepID=A0A2H1KWF3_9MICO|nr:hypothetical protein BANT918_02965 [Brevibacterium antiquum CNRZ 918]